ncbi:transglutaminase domain-containing protein [Methanobrevibacter filiformis]|uniref:Transglutaminase-like superfamily protein n=1 Tax=Methanobrevibacter filiformis TaxID=55758 RepID=A0A166APH3_9EURY|nr:transglutaminase-like domain-containing protein [Methanobrevibacter filiformis]KZX12302.1 transglutaminase-like superfamily protein [Methanobrevibacter filiformis]
MKRGIISIILVVLIIFSCSVLIDSINAADSDNSSSNDIDTKIISQKDVVNASKTVYKHINNNQKLPDSVIVSGEKYSTAEFMYMMSKTIENKYNGINSAIVIKKNIANPSNPTGSNINETITSKSMYNYSKAITTFINTNNRAPNYVKTTLGKMSYQTTIFGLSKILSKTTSTGKLPSKITVNVSKSSPVNNNGYSINLFSEYKGDSREKYLVSTTNAPAKDSYVKNLAKKLTKKSKTTLEKAEAIFNWVKTNIKYSRYSNTKYGGKKTILYLKGNCVDNTHAIVSLMRAIGIPARYVNGRCEFTKGTLAKVTVSHVWGQVLINNKWYVVDGIYSGNRLGYVANWKTGSYSLYGIYNSI